MERLEDLVDKANDIIDQQISRILQSISHTLLLVIGGNSNNSGNSLTATKSMASISGNKFNFITIYILKYL